MNTLIAFAIVCLSSALAYPYQSVDLVQTEDGQEFYLIPVEQHSGRVRRQTDYGYGNEGAYLSHTQKIINTDIHQLDATAYAQKNFTPKGPFTTGQSVGYVHKPSESELSLAAKNVRGQGTDVSATGTYNFLRSQDGRGKVGAYGEYSRHYGGASGTLKPEWGAGVRASYNF